jgi:NADPH-dependent curcumin reductase CurA
MLASLLLVLSGQKCPTPDEQMHLLKVAAMCGVCGLYEHYKMDIEKFSTEELQLIAETTRPFTGFTIEHIYHTALFGWTGS